eukprot:CAMPEP_0117764552 /NCGR_PEP_ID=MMETSP0947-20121206/19455_1 /TAXON_ID=44440 /ORGANISM="Chattonella subsalsa, Strain CCMP2191" /LENGTH=47 /DNA_ID= /DNA_START= /DNA_END= /DNA_ORIENTATION=
MDDGSTEATCLDVEADNCYHFDVVTEGSYPVEVSYSICGASGSTELG